MNSTEILAFNVADACKALGIGRTKLYGLIAERQIEARSLGGRTVIPAASLRAFVSNLPAAPIRKSLEA
jgi:excisionase family DNA binding protein